MHATPLPLSLYVESYSTSDLPLSLWLSEAAITREIVEDEWPSASDDLPAEHQIDLRLRRNHSEGWSAYGHLLGAAIHLSWTHGHLRVATCGQELEACAGAMEALRELFPENEPGDARVPITIWLLSRSYPEARRRKIEPVAWQSISGNYARKTAAELERLMAWREPSGGGRLLLWHGQPGTGKTWALRAMANEWRDWCELHYISDPEVLLGGEPGYLLEVVLGSGRAEDEEEEDAPEEGDEPPKWRLIVLEDAGEMLSLDAKERVGQALGRLLNLTDGLLGQGTRTLVLITTNEELGHLHPAIQRPGRCAATVPFDPLDRERACRWLTDRGCTVEIDGSRTLAELYGQLEGVLRPAASRPVGFARPPASKLAASDQSRETP